VTLLQHDRREVVGIVEDVHAGRLTQAAVPQFYVPFTDSGLGIPSAYVIRTSRALDAVRRDVAALVRAIDPRMTVRVMSARDAIALPLALQTLTHRLTIAMAFVALLLAVFNVYALSAFAVVQRTREIGIRIALGATAADAMRLVMRRGIAWVAAGLVLGIGATVFAVAPLLQEQLLFTRTSDPRLLGLALVLVSAVAVLASWVPARRAAAIDPAAALRAE
jgi:hypothetical protein